MTSGHPWMWHWGGMWVFPMFILLAMIFVLFMFFGRPSQWRQGTHGIKNGETDSALDILKKRYVKGEIKKEEFEQMKQDILS